MPGFLLYSPHSPAQYRNDTLRRVPVAKVSLMPVIFRRAADTCPLLGAKRVCGARLSKGYLLFSSMEIIDSRTA